jgi:hypothetical protein
MYYAIFIIGIAHVLSGVSILISPHAAMVTPLAELLALAGPATASVLIVAGCAAIFSQFVPDGFKVGLIVPQQAIITIQIGSLVLTLIHGHYPDGYVPSTDWPRLFILNDQIWALSCGIFHTWEVLQLSR